MNTADDNTETAEETSKTSKWNAMREKRQSRIRPPDNPKGKKGANTREEQSNEQESDKPDILDLFAKDELMEGCIPLFLSKATQQVFNIVADENVTKLKPSALIPKSDILKDIQLRASVSDFSVHKTIINDYNGLEILVIYDADMKFGENFVLVTNEEAKNHILNPIEDQMDQLSGDEDSDAELEEASDSVTFFRPNIRRPWISLGSDKEVMESSIIETRPKVYTIFQRPRREFGAPVTFSDRDATDKGASSLVTTIPEKANEIPIMEVDKSVSNAQLTSERGTNTDWKYPRNAFTQYTPRVLTAEELQTMYAPGGPLQDIGKHFPTLKQGLLQNMMYDFLASDFENLAAGDETYDTRADNTFKEFLSFTDLKFSKDKAVTDIQWHPTIKGIVGMSVGERIDYDHRADQSSRILLTSTHIILWSFADPIQPQLLLEAPEDILCFQFNPTDPNIVAGGCFNGMVVLWDIEKHMEDLRKVKARMKAKNKAPLFSFDDTDPNRVPVSPYCAISNIEASHTSPILDLKWVPDHVEINRLGYCLENVSLKCVQLITSGLNNELLFWDIRPDRSPLAVDKTRDSILPPRNVPTTFMALDMKWKPLLRVHLYKSEAGGDHAPTKFCIREAQGDRRILSANAEDRTNPTMKSSTLKNKPLQGASTMLYVGTEDGDLVYVDWMPQKDPDTGKMQTPKPEFYATQHDGPISYLARSPFEPSVLLVVGGWTWSIWKEGVNSGPLLESGHAQKPLTGGSWSPTRPSVFFICRADGSLEVWDLLDKTHEPAMVQSVSANALTAISLCNFSKRQIVAIGDTQGALQLFVVPRRLRSILASELANFNAYIEREVRRREFVLMRWNIREQEKIEQEAERKRQAGIAPAVVLTEEETLQKEALEYEEYLKNEQSFLRQLGLVKEE
ncbi:WD repeat-containing protein 63 [Clonorchis sinensis]|uniref:WD repeat-containing protein 63 n=1 Tax=Clonorchis sinensis TaxID=79923 RepID=A0A419QC02_CLOSI|nr:WD repeat-containing protein 63 [Clonorchis sinensis]